MSTSLIAPRVAIPIKARKLLCLGGRTGSHCDPVLAYRGVVQFPLVNGKYQVLGLIGQGGMASVYRAIEVPNGRLVALKVLSGLTPSTGETIRDGEDGIARFEREARAVETLDTEHIARIYDAGIDLHSGARFMAIELLEGEDLQKLVDRLGRVPPALALRLVGQACVALWHAHGVGVIHRDVKPSNLFLTRAASGKLIVKVLDFGLAKMLGDSRAEASPLSEPAGLTKPGATLGTPEYMSPEQIMHPKEVDYRADVWSLGIVLYKLLTGVTPHHGYPSIGELLVGVVTKRAPLLRDIAPDVAPEVAAIAHRAIEIDPLKRYQGMQHMLREILERSPGGLEIDPDMVVGAPDPGPMFREAPLTERS